jgi:hypothetical protein
LFVVFAAGSKKAGANTGLSEKYGQKIILLL